MFFRTFHHFGSFQLEMSQKPVCKEKVKKKRRKKRRRKKEEKKNKKTKKNRKRSSDSEELFLSKMFIFS